MRADATVFSEVVSEGIFSEEVQLIDQQGDWIKIATVVDGYQGWVTAESICSREIAFLSNKDGVTVNRSAVHLYDQPDTIYGPCLTLPLESRLELYNQLEGGRWLEIILPNRARCFVQRGDVETPFFQADFKSLALFSRRFLGLPYTWGGRSSFGYDCSGYVQMLYRQMGIYLPRDAKDQYQWERLTAPISLTQLELGDLIFFGYDQERIRHVGFHLGEGSFIHTVASTENAPYLRISNLKDQAWNGSGLYLYVSAKRLIL